MKNLKANTLRIGVVSDTHGYFDPVLHTHLDGVEVILHAGDVGSRDVLDELNQVAPVQAVRGNVDAADLDLPLSLISRFDGVQVQMQHILPVPSSELETWAGEALPGEIQSKKRDEFLNELDKATRVMIFGHTHQPCLIALGHALFFNPGSAGRKRFSLPCCCGVLEISSEGIRGMILSLEGKTKNEAAWLPVEK